MTNYQIALEVVQGKWGNDVDRKNRITNAGYDYYAVQSIVNAILSDGYEPTDEDLGNTISVEENRTLTVEVDLTKYDKLVLELIT